MSNLTKLKVGDAFVIERRKDRGALCGSIESVVVDKVGRDYLYINHGQWNEHKFRRDTGAGVGYMAPEAYLSAEDWEEQRTLKARHKTLEKMLRFDAHPRWDLLAPSDLDELEEILAKLHTRRDR